MATSWRSSHRFLIIRSTELDPKTTQAFDHLETWYRKQTNKRRLQGIAIAGGLAACLAAGPQFLAIASIGSAVLFGVKLVSSKRSG